MRVRCTGVLLALMMLAASVPAREAAPSPAVGTAEPAAVERPEYRVTVDAELRWLQVHACFARDLVLRPLDPVGRRHLRSVTLMPRGQPAQQHAPGPRIVVPEGCVEYRFDLRRAAQARADSRIRRVGRDLLVSPNLWMWLPEPDGGGAAPAAAVDVLLEPPPGVTISVPWPELTPAAASGAGRYRLQPGPAGWHPVAAFGTFRIHRVPVGDRVLRLAVLDGEPPADEAIMIEWLGGAARSLLSLTPSFPVPSPQVLVVPVAGTEHFGGAAREDAVPFARVLRDGGTAAQFFVDQRSSLARLEADWTAAHEFAHMLLPFVSLRDAWISEGFASYYQNVLRARSGQLDPAQAWQRLHEGFERGRREGDEDYEDTLRESIRDGGSNSTMRMYWSGAAVALLADLELRRRSGGRSSLDAVLARFAACCLPSRRSWSGRALFDHLDVLSGTDVFSGLYERHADSTRFPDLDAAYARLGLRIDAGGMALDAAPDADLRDAIMAQPDRAAVRSGP